MKHAIVAVIGVALLSGGVAQAQSQNKAAAETAFRRGKELIAAGKVADACASFEQSQKLDAQLGTQYNLALCYERLGKLASAWVTFSELAERDSNAGRKADSAKRARKLEPRLTKLVIRPAESTPGLTVTQDGADITLLVGAEAPVDPGTYQFEARAPGRRTWTQPVTVAGEGKVVTVDIPVLDVDPSSATPEPARPDEPGQPLPRVDDTAPTGDRGRTRRLIGLGVGGAGVLSVVVGSVFGVQASGLKDDADKLCGGDSDNCTGDLDAAQDKIDDARGKATLSTVFVGVGLAAVAGGAVLYFTAPKSGERNASLTPVIDGDQVGVALSGRF